MAKTPEEDRSPSAKPDRAKKEEANDRVGTAGTAVTAAEETLDCETDAENHFKDPESGFAPRRGPQRRLTDACMKSTRPGIGAIGNDSAGIVSVIAAFSM